MEFHTFIIAIIFKIACRRYSVAIGHLEGVVHIETEQGSRDRHSGELLHAMVDNLEHNLV